MADAKRILVIDDEPAIRGLVQMMLETEGYAVTVAENGEQGLEQISETPPDLVLLDLMMPVLSGWDVIERLKEHPAPPPVIAISGQGGQEPPEFRAVRRFVYGYLPKPFGAEQLLKTCARAIAASRPAPPSRGADRRSEPRRSLLVFATLRSPDGSPVALAQILNLSTHGLEMDLGAPLEPGMELALTFEIPGAQGPFHVIGNIKWRKEGRLGLAFKPLSPEEEVRLRELLGDPDGNA